MAQMSNDPMSGSSSIRRKPLLRTALTDDIVSQQAHVEDAALAEQTAVLQSMSLETPTGMIESPTSYTTSMYGDNTSVGTLDSNLTTPVSPLAPSPSESSKAGKYFRTAMQDVRHFAGGLISHPYESTKHYSILRHSHGLVYYTGSYTNLAITIFSDREIPPDRTLWLQRRGYSGKTGLKIGGLLGARSTWIDVTPAVQATPDQLDPSDERAWQRDIKKFLKKAPKDIQSHRVRETDILRIPCDADDGYLRVVLCTAEGKKVLCGSPIFRLASSSTDVSSIRGASLMTMPLEVGIKIASVVANNAATVALTPVADTARSFVTTQVTQIYQPSAVAQQAMTSAYDRSGVQDRIDNANEKYDEARDSSYTTFKHATYDSLTRPGLVGDDSGPESPFPVRFHGKVVPGSGKSRAQLNAPTANLAGVSEDILLRYQGVYFGWAAINLPKKLAAEKRISEEWRQAVIFILPDTSKTRKVVQPKTVRIYLIHDFNDQTFFDAKLSVILMGFLRAMNEMEPTQDSDIDSQLFDFCKDIAITTASLARSEWKAENTLERIKSASSARSISERYVDFRQTSQKQIDRIPVHRLGIRTEGASLRDGLIGQGGVWVSRQGLTHASTA